MLDVRALLLLPLLLVSVRGAVEHRVSGDQALDAASALHPQLDPRPPGCGACSQKELRYCAGTAVLHDHCCCDMSYHEAFPYVPHTCYLTEEMCTVRAGDCEEYTRLRTCCCDHILRAKWKMLSGSNLCSYVSVTLLLLCLLASLLGAT